MKKRPTYRYRQANISLFENEQTLASLSKQGNPLEYISMMVDFEIFRPVLESRLQTQERKKQCRSSPYRPHTDVQGHVSATAIWAK